MFAQCPHKENWRPVLFTILTEILLFSDCGPNFLYCPKLYQCYAVLLFMFSLCKTLWIALLLKWAINLLCSENPQWKKAASLCFPNQKPIELIAQSDNKGATFSYISSGNVYVFVNFVIFFSHNNFVFCLFFQWFSFLCLNLLKKCYDLFCNSFRCFYCWYAKAYLGLLIYYIDIQGLVKLKHLSF